VLVERLVVGDLASCAYIVAKGDHSECIIIDPGAEGEALLKIIEKHNLRPKFIVNTHGHSDHIAANSFLKQRFPDLEICIHQDDARMLKSSVKNLSLFFGRRIRSPQADRLLKEGDTLEIEGCSFKVLHIPGHTKGGIALLRLGWQGEQNDPPVIFTGDTLFAGGIGRSDFPFGSQRLLVQGIKEKIMTLPDESQVYPGHGPPTTVGEERANNPFL
jgi:glyoxylase-like metal-dependent hydrolase (beta-lactamase superfamily II)